MSTIINESSLGNIIIVTGSFVLLLLLIKVFAWQQITGIFLARSEKISSDIDGAETARQKAEELANKRELELSMQRMKVFKSLRMQKVLVKIRANKLLHQLMKKQIVLRIKLIKTLNNQKQKL